MSKGFRKLEEGADQFLHEGERLEVIQPVRNKGSIDAAAFGGAIGAVAGARGSKGERAAAESIGVELGAFMAMGITGERLLLFSVGGVAKIKDLLSELPLTEVDSITVDKAMLGARKRITVRVRGGEFVLETPGRHRRSSARRCSAGGPEHPRTFTRSFAGGGRAAPPRSPARSASWHGS